jgi:hypothetical protein
MIITGPCAGSSAKGINKYNNLKTTTTWYVKCHFINFYCSLSSLKRFQFSEEGAQQEDILEDLGDQDPGGQ